MLSWDEYIKKGIVRKTSLDRGMIVSLVRTSDEGLQFFKNDVSNEKNANLLLKNYYDFLREICKAVALSKEYKIYQHEAITLFLKKLGEEEMAFKFNRLRILRNGVHYYGRTISAQETLKAISDIKFIIDRLKAKYLKEYLG